MKFNALKEIIYNFEKYEQLETTLLKKNISYDFKKNNDEIEIIINNKQNEKSLLTIILNKKYDCFFLKYNLKEDSNHELCITIPTKTPEIEDNEFKVDFVNRGKDIIFLNKDEFKAYIYDQSKYKNEMDFKNLISDTSMPKMIDIIKENNSFFIDIIDFIEKIENKIFDVEVFNTNKNINKLIKKI